jgi:hypothetical protein
MALTIVTNPVTAITTTTATCGGNTIAGTITGSITAKGVCWSTTYNPTVSLSTKTTNGTGNSNFTSSITSLTPGIIYYVRAYVTDGSGTYYGANVVFTTLGLTTTAATSITSTTAISGANSISGFSLGSISSSGVCWGTSVTPIVGVGNFTSDIIIGSVFTSYITGLNAGTLYYVRSYIISGATTYYGNQITFTTSSVLPIVTTTSTIASITISGATVSGNVASGGGSSVTARGIQYSLIPNMSSGQTNVSSGTGTGTFSAALTGLTLGTTYYVRAYATNTTGTSYGAIYNFTTLGGPLVETVIPYSITSSTAQVGCNILSIGGSVLTARGVVISTSPGPTLSTGSVFSDLYYGSAVPQYLTKLTSLTKDTTYYIRAYATNTQGTSYGEELIFSTTSCNPLVEDCNPQHEPPVICSEPGCEYIIPLECVVGDIPTSSVSCSNISLTPDENTLLSELQKINEMLCTLSSRDFIIFYLTSIYNSNVLKTIFCDVKTRCTTIDATVSVDTGGASIISITAITPTTYVLIGRTITCGTGGKFTAGTKITGFVSGVNGGVGVYTISSPMLAAYTGSITLTFV